MGEFGLERGRVELRSDIDSQSPLTGPRQPAGAPGRPRTCKASAASPTWATGNSVTRVFDRDLTRPEEQPRPAQPVTISFRPS
jgi:hypothetical protein